MLSITKLEKVSIDIRTNISTIHQGIHLYNFFWELIMDEPNYQAVSNFIFELAQLREKNRSGWGLIKVPDKEKVSSHVLRATQLAYVIAVLENHPDPNYVGMCALFHENGETRLPDFDKVAARYIVKVDEMKAVLDQTRCLGKAGENIFEFWKEAEDRKTLAGIIAKDADYLECAFSAKEYMEQGHTFASDWTKNVSSALRTDAALRIFDAMMSMTSNDWWQGLKKLS